jgi:predicted flap endonuclease-1-like 5' DNA nuclease
MHRNAHPPDKHPGKELAMKALKVFLFGLLYGWFLKFAIDRIYRENEIEDIRNENESLREHVRSLEAKLQSGSTRSTSTTRKAAASRPAPSLSGKDDLKLIKGIGPAIEKKLNGAGIDSFEALSQLTVAELGDILGSTSRLVKDGESLIAQARSLAQQRGK